MGIQQLRIGARPKQSGREASMGPIFHDRMDAGRKVAAKLAAYENRPDVLVLGLPRGGVPVAFEVSRSLSAPLDVFVVRKLGVPGQEELAMGAIATSGVVILNDAVIQGLAVPDKVIYGVIAMEEQELERRERLYRGNRPPPEIQDNIVILVDDGLATGSTMRAAVEAVRRQGPQKVVVAVPVGAASTCEEFQHVADEIVCAATPNSFYAVGLWYEDFTPTTDQEVRELLVRAGRRLPAQPDVGVQNGAV